MNRKEQFSPQLKSNRAKSPNKLLLEVIQEPLPNPEKPTIRIFDKKELLDFIDAECGNLLQKAANSKDNYPIVKI